MINRIRLRARVTIAFTVLLTAMAAAMVIAISFYLFYIPTYTVAVPGTGSTRGPEQSDAGQLAVSSPYDVVRVFLWGAIGALVLFVAIGALIAWFMAGRLLRPLREINRAAEQAGTGSLNHRIHLTGPADEAKDTADTFDRMLDRLQSVFDAQERFTANAAHELRTPLAATKTFLQVAAAHPGQLSTAELIENLTGVNDSNIATVEALLTLSRADAGVTNKVAVDLDTLTSATVALRAVEAEKCGLRITTATETCSAMVDPTLWRTLVDNLMSNAIRYNHPGGWIRVGLHRTTGFAELAIENTGVPVGDDIGRLTEPFYRAEGRIAHPANSHGLGLAIVRSIASAHDGRVAITSREGGGLKVVVTIPSTVHTASR